jgi:hypothetical protein
MMFEDEPRPAIRAFKEIFELFADGYCDCRCGPRCHGLFNDEGSAVVEVYCKYHRRVCRATDVSLLEANDLRVLKRMALVAVQAWR